MDFDPVLQLIGFLLRVLGSLVFGLGIGWIAVKVMQKEPAAWQLSMAVFLGLVGGFALLGHWVPGGGTLGAFGLGAGAAVLLWGLMANRMKSEDDDSPKKK
ncbi:MAG: hypothetical protein WD040_07505 [Anaerolineales bacterium]